MNLHSTDPNCRFRSFAEAERYAERRAQIKLWESFGVYMIDGRISHSPPKGNRIKRMCLACRRREVRGRAKFCENGKCIRARSKRPDDRLRGRSESIT
jgi:hypothetical protein